MIKIDERLYGRSWYKNLDKSIGLDTFIDRKRRKINDNEDDFFIYLFQASDSVKYKCAAETGFFDGCMHIDKNNLYEKSIIHSPEAQEMIDGFEYDEDIMDLMDFSSSKYKQPDEEIDWRGVVFASQNPNDRSVKSVTTPQTWWDKLKEACQYYGDQLLIKLHPWNAKKANAEEIIREMSKKYGCTCGYFNHSCIMKCEHVLLGCSSFSVDCMLRGVPVKQIFPGYFHSCKAITYCRDDLKMDIRSDCDVIEEGKKLANFLASHYCFRMDISQREWRKIIMSFYMDRQTNNPFPLPEEISYYSYLKSQPVHLT